ncbi:myosin [Acrasis kona]|uniref:Myosin n=1 Tax=Acrasis kona TaxID=1008807 RepID=A0AAW2YYE8_9EUKA
MLLNRVLRRNPKTLSSWSTSTIIKNRNVIFRLQSTDATVESNPTNEDPANAKEATKDEEKKDEIDIKFPEVTLTLNEVFNEEHYKKLPIDLATSKQIASELSKLVQNDQKIQSELSSIASMSNDGPSLFDKYQKLLSVLRNARRNFVENAQLKGSGRQMDGVDIDADIKLRTTLGRWSRRDQELLSSLQELYKYLSKKVFNVDLEYLIPDARCCGIHVRAHQDAEKYICSDPEIINKNISNPLLPKEFADQVFKREMELLKDEEVDLTKYTLKRKLIEQEIEKFKEVKKIDEMMWKTDKEGWEKLTDLTSEHNVEESDINERFSRRISNSEGWVCYKFQAMDVVYRFG